MRALTLGCCLAVAVTLAFCVNQLIEAALQPPPAGEERRPRAEPPQRALDPDRLARTLGTPLRPRAGQAPTRPLPLKLVGTLDDYAAAVADAASGQCRTLRVGDRWDDVELVEVGHGRITVRRDGKLEQVGIGAVAHAPVATAAGFAVAFSASGASMKMGRDELQRQLPDLARRAMEGGRIVPAFEGGVMTGFRLVALRPGSLYEELGLKNGDVLETINGAQLSSPDVAFNLVGRLRDQSHLALVVNRQGQRLTWDLSLN